VPARKGFAAQIAINGQALRGEWFPRVSATETAGNEMDGIIKNYDVSLSVMPETPVWPGDSAPRLPSIQRLHRGDPANLSPLDATLHLATHVDAPFHVFERARTVDALLLSVLIGPALLVEAPPPRRIDRREPELHSFRAVLRVLFKINNGGFCHRVVMIA